MESASKVKAKDPSSTETVKNSTTVDKTDQKNELPKITVSTMGETDNGNKRFSTGSDYTEWRKDNTQYGSSNDICSSAAAKGVLEPRLSVQTAHLNTQSTSSLNLLDSASQAGCILDTDIENCERLSENVLEPNDGESCNKSHRPSIEESNQRIIEWLDTVPKDIPTAQVDELQLS